jgi:hypothetical protein
MKFVTAMASTISFAVAAGLMLCQPGCSRSSTAGAPLPTTRVASQALSAGQAATLAARLANDQCERQYRKRPFTPAQHSAVLKNGVYEWGGLDVGGPGGFSALVTFRRDGSDPHVEVYFSSDALAPPRLR